MLRDKGKSDLKKIRAEKPIKTAGRRKRRYREVQKGGETHERSIGGVKIASEKPSIQLSGEKR